jgi:hypothetical protein
MRSFDYEVDCLRWEEEVNEGASGKRAARSAEREGASGKREDGERLRTKD